jgi:hypothetical protein
MGGEDAVDLFHLPWRQVLVGIEAPAPLQQALAPQHLVQSRDAAGKAVAHVEEGGVGVREGRARRQQVERACAARAAARADRVEGPHRLARPHRPLAEQPAREAERRTARRGGWEVGEQVGHDAVVVAGVERDIVPPAGGQRSRHLERPVAVEGCDLDGDDRGNLQELAPERMIKDAPAHRRLEVEAEERDRVRHLAAVLEQRLVGRVAQCGQAEQARVVSEIAGELGFGDRLRRGAADARDRDERGPASRGMGVQDVHGDREDRPQQRDRGSGSRTASYARRRLLLPRPPRSSSG